MTTIDATARFGQPGNVADLALKRVQKADGAAEAKRRWQAGLVVPHRITLALDIRRLDGPGVDEACGVQPPAVDRWEQGLTYPTWDELCRLAILTDFPVAFFTENAEHLVGSVHLGRIEGNRVEFRAPMVVLMFTPTAVRRALGGRGAGGTTA